MNYRPISSGILVEKTILMGDNVALLVAEPPVQNRGSFSTCLETACDETSHRQFACFSRMMCLLARGSTRSCYDVDHRGDIPLRNG
jgi:hypothetical protein